MSGGAAACEAGVMGQSRNYGGSGSEDASAFDLMIASAGQEVSGVDGVSGASGVRARKARARKQTSRQNENRKLF